MASIQQFTLYPNGLQEPFSNMNFYSQLFLKIGYDAVYKTTECYKIICKYKVKYYFNFHVMGKQ